MNFVASAVACAIGLLVAFPAGAHEGPEHIHLSNGLVIYASALALLVIAAVCGALIVRRRGHALIEETADAAVSGRNADPAAGA